MADLTKDDVKDALLEGLIEHWQMLGVDLSTPEKRLEFTKDLDWVRTSRIGISLHEAEKDHEFIRALRRQLSTAAERIGYAILIAAVGGMLWLAGLGEKIKLLH